MVNSSANASPVFRRTAAGEPLGLVEELRELARYRNLLRELVQRDLTVRYKRSVLGFLWTMLHPLLLMAIFTAVFSHGFRFQMPHYATYFLSEYLGWLFFAQTTLTAMASLAWNGPLMRRVRVPLSIFTLSTIISGLVNFALSAILLLVVMAVTGTPITTKLFLLPVGVAILAVFTFGIALILTSVTAFFADVREMFQAAMPAMMYLTPIVYPLAIVPARFRVLIEANPLMYLLEIIRDPIYYGAAPSSRALAIAAASAAVSMVCGWAVFRRLAPKLHAQV